MLPRDEAAEMTPKWNGCPVECACLALVRQAPSAGPTHLARSTQSSPRGAAAQLEEPRSRSAAALNVRSIEPSPRGYASRLERPRTRRAAASLGPRLARHLARHYAGTREVPGILVEVALAGLQVALTSTGPRQAHPGRAAEGLTRRHDAPAPRATRIAGEAGGADAAARGPSAALPWRARPARGLAPACGGLCSAAGGRGCRYALRPAGPSGPAALSGLGRTHAARLRAGRAALSALRRPAAPDRHHRGPGRRRADPRASQPRPCAEATRSGPARRCYRRHPFVRRARLGAALVLRSRQAALDAAELLDQTHWADDRARGEFPGPATRVPCAEGSRPPSSLDR